MSGNLTAQCTGRAQKQRAPVIAIVSQVPCHTWSRRPGRHTIGLMPTVLRIGPYRFFFYSGDRDEPRMCMWSGKRAAESSGWTRYVLAESGGFGRAEIRRLETVVRENAMTRRRAWDEYFAD